jgi:DNA-binding MarR family transcriptional regulator
MKYTFAVYLHICFLAAEMTIQRSHTDAARAAAVASDLRVLIGKLVRRLRQQVSPSSLSWSQVAVIGHLERQGPATVSALAGAENMRPQSMSTIVASLEAAGLVSGAPDPIDGRQTIWSVTEKSRQWIKRTRLLREDWLFQVIRTNFSTQEQKDLARGIELLKRVADA